MKRYLSLIILLFFSLGIIISCGSEGSSSSSKKKNKKTTVVIGGGGYSIQDAITKYIGTYSSECVKSMQDIGMISQFIITYNKLTSVSYYYSYDGDLS